MTFVVSAGRPVIGRLAESPLNPSVKLQTLRRQTAFPGVQQMCYTRGTACTPGLVRENSLCESDSNLDPLADFISGFRGDVVSSAAVVTKNSFSPQIQVGTEAPQHQHAPSQLCMTLFQQLMLRNFSR